jgi:putative aldouronate transport system substrate-binding protein
MGKSVKICLSALVVMIMMFTTACSSSKKIESSNSPSSAQSVENTAPAASEAPPREVVTIKIVEGINVGGIDVNDAVSKEIEKKLGIKLEYVSSDKEKFKLMAATGDIGDIIITGGETQKQFIEGGLVIALDDLIQTHGKDIAQNSANKLAFSKKYLSDGKDQVYWLPAHGISNVDDFKKMSQFEYQLGAYVRWDYYKELGYPAVNNLDDYLKVLADMQKKHPKTADGKKTYPIALWTDWGNLAMMESNMNNISSIKSQINFYDDKGDMKDSLLSDNFFLWKSLKFYYNAHKMGLLDPDSFTQKNDNVKQKIINGQIFAYNNSWFNGELNPKLAENFGPEAGLGMIPTAYPSAFSNAFSPIGWATSFAAGISKNSKHPDRAMELINYLNSYEGARLVYSGVKDVHWSSVSGKAAIIPEVLKQSASNPDFLKKAGIKRSTLDHLVGLDASVIDPADGTPMDLYIQPESLVLKNTPFTKAYSDHYGVTYPGAAVEKAAVEGKITLGLFNTFTVDMMPNLPDDLLRITKQIEDYLIKNLPKVILAKSDEEADAAIAKAKADIRSFGADKVTEWATAEYSKAKLAADEISK